MTDDNRTAAPAASAVPAQDGADNLETAVIRQLDQYFEQLGGSQPHPLYSLVMTAVERPLLEYAMNMCRRNQCEAAKLLGINRNTLRKQLVQHGLLH